MTDSDIPRAHLVGINHVALEVDDIEAALDFYGSIFEFELRGQTEAAAFLDMGDQFLAVTETDESSNNGDDHRHFGLVVDDPTTVERRLEELDVEWLSIQGLDFRDPWGNRVQIVGYEEIQFTKADHILEAMELSDLEKSEAAIAELSEKGMAPE
ncbi:VOC family protein [Haladaptatus halobius]|uniref:VOC family protein n=1 Tax=Haladaptatus halobius TaxID=2884875 RepID=UPI001D0A8E74|nr:VOC family protein [Haladaptatus halobius]